MNTLLYIPIWFYSNGIVCCNFFKLNILYIPIWFYSNWKIIQKLQHRECLYIPIWFYSNVDGSVCSPNFINFTFQSGSIQITQLQKKYNELLTFTFQSGSIQINKLDDYTIRYTLLYIPIWFYSNGYYRKLQRVYERSLHSNLVLFKSCINFLWPFSTRTLHSNLVLFKFHFLNTHIHYYVSLHSNLVLFK